MSRRRLVAVGAASLLALPAAHLGVGYASRMAPAPVRVPALEARSEGGVRRAGGASVRKVGKILEVRLAGTPEEIGSQHATLLHDDMVATEGVVWKLLDDKVPNRFARWLLLDAGQLAYRNLPASLPDEWLRELSASAAAFRPDPFEGRFGTFQRFVYLNALYDISLGYEHSPLLGCTTFTFSGADAAGSPLLARAFDFDVDDVFDTRKAVFLVRGEGLIPFASVAWPGLVGVVSGMNREGLAAVVHGARGGPTRTVGEPVVRELRRVLSRARTTDEAARAIAETDPLVSHIVILMDAEGRAAVVERVPGEKPHVRPLGTRGIVTNHLEGPFASDPKNLRVRAESSTLSRRARGDEIVRTLARPATATDAVRFLRDREGAGGTRLAPGDRRAIDASIATHGVVMETASRRLWVSEGPHLSGRFVSFDLGRLLDPDLQWNEDPPHDEIAPDPRSPRASL